MSTPKLRTPIGWYSLQISLLSIQGFLRVTYIAEFTISGLLKGWFNIAVITVISKIA